MIFQHSVKHTDATKLYLLIVLGGNGTINIISETSTFYAVRVTSPTTGVWDLSIIAFGPFTLQVTAQSSLFFTTTLEKEEYSSAFEKILVPISGYPIKGKENYAPCGKFCLVENSYEIDLYFGLMPTI